jgi:hypothetical protein
MPCGSLQDPTAAAQHGRLGFSSVMHDQSFTRHGGCPRRGLHGRQIHRPVAAQSQTPSSLPPPLLPLPAIKQMQLTSLGAQTLVVVRVTYDLGGHSTQEQPGYGLWPADTPNGGVVWGLGPMGDGLGLYLCTSPLLPSPSWPRKQAGLVMPTPVPLPMTPSLASKRSGTRTRKLARGSFYYAGPCAIKPLSA